MLVLNKKDRTAAQGNRLRVAVVMFLQQHPSRAFTSRGLNDWLIDNYPHRACKASVISSLLRVFGPRWGVTKDGWDRKHGGSRARAIRWRAPPLEVMARDDWPELGL